MPELSIDAHLDATICTNEETRSFIKVGISINGIDPAGDVDAQLQQGLETGRAAIRVINDGLVEEVSDAITVTDNPTRIIDQVGSLEDRIGKIESLMSKVVLRVRDLISKTGPGAEEAPQSEVVVEQPEAVKEKKKGKKT